MGPLATFRRSARSPGPRRARHVAVLRGGSLGLWLVVTWTGCSPAACAPPAHRPADPPPVSVPREPPAKPDEAHGLLVHLPLDEGEGSETRETVSGRELAIEGPGAPEWAPGPTGSALRLDGFTRAISTSLPPGAVPSDALTAEAWVALEAYPVANAPFVAKYTFPERGFFFGVEPRGRWYLGAAIDGEWHTVWARDPLPTGRWAHVAATFDRERGMSIHLDGERVGEQATPAGRPLTPEEESALTIGRDVHGPWIGAEFPTGLLNGLVDEVRVHDRALSDQEIRASFASATAPARAALEVSEARHTDDPHRPAYHAMPPSAWTNEPHGLLRVGDRWHLFFQQNPSGPYWGHIHWGHMVSPDLVRWEPRPPALRPEEGFDRVGIWSGNAVIDDEGVPTLVYTGVDGARATVALARGRDGMRRFEKHPGNPVIAASPAGFEDFRDPFVWREDEGWYLLIGSGVPPSDGHEGGGTALLYRSGDLERWELLGPLLVGERATSGRFWEMPMLLPVGHGKHAFLVTTVEIAGPPRTLYWLGTFAEGRFTPEHPDPRVQDPLHSVLSPTIAIDDRRGAGDGEAGARLVGLGIVPEARSSVRQAQAGWAHTFSLPRVYSLSADGTRLRQAPLPELASLRDRLLVRVRDTPLAPDAPIELAPSTPLGSDRYELDLVIDPGDARRITLALARSPDGAEETRIVIAVPEGAAEGMVRVDRRDSSLDPEVARDLQEGELPLRPASPIRLRVFVDRSIVEVFVDDESGFATRIYPTRADSRGATLRVHRGRARLERADAWSMRAAR